MSKCKYIIGLMFLLAIGSSVFGAYCSWLGGTISDPNNWAVAANWGCGIVPNTSYIANISTNGSAPVIKTNVGTSQGIYMAPSTASDNVLLTVDGGIISLSQNIYISTVGSGYATINIQNSGSITALGTGSYGNLNLNGSGHGTLNIISGTVETKYLALSGNHMITIGSAGFLILQGDVTIQINTYIQSGLITTYQGQGSLTAAYFNGKTYVSLQGIPQGNPYLYSDIDGNNKVDLLDLTLLASEWLMVDPNNSTTRMPWIDARMYNSGALTDTTIRQAINAIGGVKRTLLLGAGTWQVNNTFSVPSNINLKFEQGAVLNVNGSYVVNINGLLEAPTIQIFSGTGKVVLSSMVTEAYPQWWGTPGASDDTAMCMSAVNSGSKNIHFPAATYNIDADGTGEQYAGLALPSDINVVFDKGSKLKVIPNSSSNYSAIYISGKNNVTVSGAVIEGDRAAHTGTTGEWGMGILVSASSNVKISDVNAHDCWGDGIYISGVSNGVTVENSGFDHNRRNGCSIINAKNIQFNNCVFSNTDGTSPFKGVDLEPNYDSDILQNISFNNCRSFKNLTKGIGIAYDGTLTNTVSVTINNWYSDSDGIGFSLDAGPRNTAGFMTINNFTSVNARETGFSCFGANLYTAINGLHIVNPNQGNSSNNRDASGIVFWMDTTSTNKISGNVHATNVDVQSTDGKAKYALYMSNDSTSPSTTGFKDIDIQMTTNMSSAKRFFKNTGPYSGYCNIVFTDNPVYSSTTNITAANIYKYISQKLTNQSATSPVTFYFNGSLAASFDSTYSIDVLSSYGITLNFSGYNLMPGNLSTYTSTQQGAHLKVRSDGTNFYVVENIGTWQ